jgi:hypothetical protein
MRAHLPGSLRSRKTRIPHRSPPMSVAIAPVRIVEDDDCDRSLPLNNDF